MEPTLLRYRREDGQACIDVHVDGIERVFDRRDPAPFRERDLDPDLEQYLRDASEDLRGHAPFRVVFWLDRPPPPGEIEHAFRGYFADVLARLDRRSRARRRTGHATLAIAVVLLASLLTLAHIVSEWIAGAFGAGLREGLVIAGWVVMWRPVEALVYDWLPESRERKLVAALLHAPLEVRPGSGPGASAVRERPLGEAPR